MVISCLAGTGGLQETTANIVEDYFTPSPLTPFIKGEAASCVEDSHDCNVVVAANKDSQDQNVVAANKDSHDCNIVAAFAATAAAVYIRQWMLAAAAAAFCVKDSHDRNFVAANEDSHDRNVVAAFSAAAVSIRRWMLAAAAYCLKVPPPVLSECCLTLGRLCLAPASSTSHFFFKGRVDRGEPRVASAAAVCLQEWSAAAST
jgi:hypothetical protein